MSYYSPQSPKNEAETGGQLIAIICGFLALAIVTFLAFNCKNCDFTFFEMFTPLPHIFEHVLVLKTIMR